MLKITSKTAQNNEDWPKRNNTRYSPEEGEFNGFFQASPLPEERAEGVPPPPTQNRLVTVDQLQKQLQQVSGEFLIMLADANGNRPVNEAYPDEQQGIFVIS